MGEVEGNVYTCPLAALFATLAWVMGGYLAVVL